jgi:lysophospholipase L1-like esterase
MSLALKFTLLPLMAVQAALTRRRLPRLPEAEGERAGMAGEPRAEAPPLRLLIAGDSSATGVGVATQELALAGQLVPRLLPHCAGGLRWRLVARSGVSTAQLTELLLQSLPIEADVALIVTGVNDLIDQVPSRRAVQARERLANLLRNGHGVRHVMFCPLPPVHQFPGLPQPLRWLAGSDARRHNQALAHWTQTRSDVSMVPLDVQLNRGVMASDGFHPGEPVYRQVAIAVAAHLAHHVQPLLRAGCGSPSPGATRTAAPASSSAPSNQPTFQQS